MNLIYDPERLWTEYGVRSLSLSDEYYGEGENYWRGPIWININYMILDSLSYYYEVSKSEDVKELCQQIYKELRQNIVENVYEQWEKQVMHGSSTILMMDMDRVLSTFRMDFNDCDDYGYAKTLG